MKNFGNFVKMSGLSESNSLSKSSGLLDSSNSSDSNSLPESSNLPESLAPKLFSAGRLALADSGFAESKILASKPFGVSAGRLALAKSSFLKSSSTESIFAESIFAKSSFAKISPLRFCLIATFCALFALLSFAPLTLHAKSSIISPLPLPTQKILDIDDKQCNESCLKKLYNQGLIFSFLAKFNQTTNDKKLLGYYADALAQLNGAIGREPSDSSHFKLALIIPKQLVGRYSVSVANTILAYLIARGIDFELEVFDCVDESVANLESSYNQVIQKNFDFVIAMLSHQGVQNLISYGNVLYPTYIPTINKERILQNIDEGEIPANLYFGGISYQQQIQLLMPIIKDSSVVEYADDSQIGSYLSELFASYNPKIIRKKAMNNQDASHFNKMLNVEERYLENNVLMLNTAASKTGLILSQLEYAENPPKIFLSTQINFNPVILQLASPKSRENLFVVSSIDATNQSLIEYAMLLNSDLRYDWVSYATSVGTEFGLWMSDRSTKRYFKESIKDRQVEYQNQLYTTKGANFVLVK
ncbi:MULTISPECIES: hypothetical protein [unclassified Helicobacter]|uniref:hypothetical protein n=1 Tax=unclassified Helicobacter TaxID=2593540 RepID=UPI00115F9972|nr:MULTISPECIES: hypothetical protein [unclassified Helicobacter]